MKKYFSLLLLFLLIASLTSCGILRPMETETGQEAVSGDSSFEIRFLDVGQGDAALVLCDGKAMLIDGGNVADSDLIYSHLSCHNISYLDVVVGTHAHEDHIGGLSGALSYAQAGVVYCPTKTYDSKAFQNFSDKVASQNKSITVPFAGDSFSLGSANCTILAVNTEADDANNSSIVLRITYGNYSFLFMGDAEREVEQALLNREVPIQSDVLKVGHHGSDTSTSYAFLREVMPRYGVISVGKDNTYGHPHEDPLSRLRDADVKTYRTDLHGDVTCRISDGELVFSVSKNETADPFYQIGSNSTQPPATEIRPPQTENSEEKVWISGSGTKYHRDSDCSGMKNPTHILKEEAVGRGFSPCGKCYG